MLVQVGSTSMVCAPTGERGLKSPGRKLRASESSPWQECDRYSRREVGATARRFRMLRVLDVVGVSITYHAHSCALVDAWVAIQIEPPLWRFGSTPMFSQENPLAT